MATKWKNIIKKGIPIVKYACFWVWLCALIVLGILIQKNNLIHYKTFRDTICKTEYTNSQEFQNLVQDAFRGMNEVYTEDLEKQLRDEMENIVKNGINRDWVYNEEKEQYQWVLDLKYSYQWNGKEKNYKNGFVVLLDDTDVMDWENDDGQNYYINEYILDLPITYSDHLLEQILELEVPIEYTAQSSVAFDTFSNIGNKMIEDLNQDQQREGIWIGNSDGEIRVVNHTPYAIDHLKNIKSSIFDELSTECVVGFSKKSLDTLVGEWDKQCKQVRNCMAVFLTAFVLWIGTTILMRVKKLEKLRIKKCVQVLRHVLCVCGTFIKRNVLGIFTGEFWYKRGFAKTEQIRTAIVVGFLLVGGILIVGGIYSCAYRIKWYVWELQIYFGVIFGVEFFVLFLYVLGTCVVTKKYQIMQSEITKISNGDFQENPSFKEESPFEAELTMLCDISSGFEKNLETRIRAERTKMELVTNVSHDLKTPLTSIISYIDLLQRMDDLPGEAREYVRILEQKSARLKAIVADVFELAKTASGEIKLNWERLNVNRLLLQTIASLEDRISMSGLQMKTKLTKEEIYIVSDGQRMYRVLQNLIDNALKYSLTGTRIYVVEEINGDFVDITVKNTANYEMDFTAEDVTERFFCGDKSRNTEGHGLGLSIAQGFTVACGGEFFVTIDGDQFNVTLHFPMSKEEENVVELEE